MTNQQGAPEALRLADEYAAAHAKWALEDLYGTSKAYTSEKLAERHAARERLAALVEAQQPAKAETLRQILTDPENQPNQYGVQFLMHGAKMAFRIGNRQFCLDYEPTEPGEFEFMRDALIDAFSIFTPDVKVAQQPAPSAAAAEIEALRALSVTNIMIDVVPGDDGMGHEVYAKSVDDVVAKLTTMGAELEDWQLGIRRYQPDPTPQADSQPALIPEAASAMVEGMDINDRVLAAIDAETRADSQPATKDLLRVALAYKDYINALPSDVVATLPAMPGIDGDWAAEVLDRAARAPADSVTAPAGAEIERLRAQAESLTRDCGRQASKIVELGADLKFQEEKHREDRARLQTLYEHQRGECWYWQGDGQDHLESLCNTLPVVIRADQLRALVSTPPAQAADSVLEDAADPLQGAANWLVKAHSGLETSTLAGKLSIGYNRAKRLHDAARKQGGA